LNLVQYAPKCMISRCRNDSIYRRDKIRKGNKMAG
jgi:hypothetical protein